MNSAKGENSDLFINGYKLHIQTQDWGPDKKIFVSQVFKDGKVTKTFKLAYDKVDQVNLLSSRLNAIKKLHQTVIDWVRLELK